MFAFFLESAFLGLFLFGEKRLGPGGHWFAGVHGVPRLLALRLLHHRHRTRGCSIRSGYGVGADGEHRSSPSFWALLINPWALWQYLHT